MQHQISNIVSLLRTSLLWVCLTVLICVASNSTTAQEIIWAKVYPLQDLDEISCITKDEWGDLYVGGYTSRNQIGIGLGEHPIFINTSNCYCTIPTGQACNCRIDQKKVSFDFHYTFMHEFGHIFGLGHTNEIVTPYISPYLVPPNNKIVGNIMSQYPEGTSYPLPDIMGQSNYFSASQVGLMHRRIEQMGLSGFLVDNFCDILHDSRADNIITTPESGIRSISWAGKRNLGGHITVENNARLNIHCELGIPKSIEGEPLTVLVAQVPNERRGGITFNDVVFAKSQTFSRVCPENAQVFFGDGNEQGLVTFTGDCDVVSGITLRFRSGSNTYIGPMARLKIRGTIIFEPGSYLCIDPSSMIEKIDNGNFEVLAGVNLTLNNSTPDAPSINCSTPCQGASFTTTTGSTYFCSPPSVDQPISLMASTFLGGQYQFFEGNSSLSPLSSTSQYNIYEMSPGTSRTFRVVIQPDGCPQLEKELTISVDPSVEISPQIGLGSTCQERILSFTSSPNTSFVQHSIRLDGNSCVGDLSLPFSAQIQKFFGGITTLTQCGLTNGDNPYYFAIAGNSLNQSRINYLIKLVSRGQKVRISATINGETVDKEVLLCHLSSSNGFIHRFYFPGQAWSSLGNYLNASIQPSSFVYSEFGPPLTISQSGLYSASLITNTGCPKLVENICIDIPTSTPAMRVEPYCEDGKFFVKANKPSGLTGSGNFVLRQQSILVDQNSAGFFKIYDPNDLPFAYDGGGFKVLYQDATGCAESQPFLILGASSSYNNLEIDRLAFVHSNLNLDGDIQIAPNALVYNRGQASITGNGNEEVPVVEAIKWTLEGKQTKLTVGENAFISAACDRMWYGIECKNAFDVNPPYLQVTLNTGAEISHAYKALHFSLPNGNARLTATGARFLHNYIGFESDQLDLGGSTLSGCTLLVDQSQLKYPFIHYPFSGHDRTGRMAINLNKGSGMATGMPLLVDNNSLISNYFIGINSYGIPFKLNQSRIERIRFKGLNLDVTPAEITNNVFSFNRSFQPMYRWMRYATQPVCCGLGNKWPGQVASNLPEYDADEPTIPLGAYGICSRYSGTTISGNSFESDLATYESGVACQVGILTNKAAFTGNTFTGVDRGVVLIKEPGTTTAMAQQIQNNTFTNNLTGVYVDNGLHNLELKCNVFQQTEEIPMGSTHFGLVISENASLEGNRIGGNGAFGNPPPNANRWPLNSLTWNSTTTPTTVDGFVSIWNKTEEDIEYWRYHNEFIGATSNTNGGSVVLPTILVGNQETFVYSAKDLCQRSSNFCGETDLPDCIQAIQANNPCPGYTFPIEINWVRACEGSVVDLVDWPIYVPKPSIPFGDLLTNQQTIEIQPDLQLGIGKPNPANQNIQIPYFIPEKSGKAELWITEVSTGKLIETIQMDKAGHGKVEITLRGYNNGVFAYKLIPENGKSSQTLKFVVIR